MRRAQRSVSLVSYAEMDERERREEAFSLPRNTRRVRRGPSWLVLEIDDNTGRVREDRRGGGTNLAPGIREGVSSAGIGRGAWKLDAGAGKKSMARSAAGGATESIVLLSSGLRGPRSSQPS